MTFKMKKSIPQRLTFSVAILSLALFGIRALPTASAQDQPAPPQAVSSNADNSMTPPTLPSDIDPNSPLGQVIRMAQSGVDQSIILAYINNSSEPFNLNSDDIIYLNDIGVPTQSVTAMIQRDQQLGVAVNPQPSPTPTEAAPPTTEVDESYFYDTLAPYGGWVNIAGYGLCWRPCVVIYNASWQPYCDNGDWLYTDDGWYWLSNYSWGWCTFHYGRWFHDSRWGWCWWPDTQWAPSWVCWRYSSGYCGWAPLPPHCLYRQGVGLVFNGVVVGANFDFGIAANFYTFVPAKNFCDSHLDRFRVRSAEAVQIFGRTKIVNNINANNRTIVNDGIPISHIAVAVGRPIQPLTIQASTGVAPRGTRGEQVGSNGRTLVVNLPRFNANAAPTLNNGIRPQPVTPHGQPPANQGMQNRPAPLIIYGHGNNSTPQTPIPQNNYERPPVQNSLPQQRYNNPNVSARSYWSTPAAETPAPNNENQRYMSPRMQEHSQRATPPPSAQAPEYNAAPREESHPVETPPVHSVPPSQSAPSHSSSSSSSSGSQQNSKNQH
jgi:Family of unknown function (DUF6600)